MNNFLVISEYKADFTNNPQKYGINNIEKFDFKTPFGNILGCYTWYMDKCKIIYIPYSGKGLSLNLLDVYPCIGWLIKKMEINNILFFSTVGSINPMLEVGDIIVIDDVIDQTKNRCRSYLELEDSKLIYHYSSTDLFCNELCEALYKNGRKISLSIDKNIFSNGNYVCSEGPRFETKAEVISYQRMGGDIVGHNLVPLVFIARELRACFAASCIVINVGEGLKRRSFYNDEELFANKTFLPELFANYIINSLEYLQKFRSEDCDCRSNKYWITLPKIRDILES